MSDSIATVWKDDESELFRLLIENVIDYAIFLLDARGHVISWNPGAERIKGFRADEIIGQHFSKFYPQESIDRRWPEHELQVAAEVGRFEDEGWRLRKDGSRFWANVVITALKDEKGALRGFSKITRDLTQRKEAEENARLLAEETAARRTAHQERERLQITLASIGDAVISTDAEGRVDFLNPVAEELVGWNSQDAAGRPLGDVFHIINENTRQPVENPALRALRDGNIVGLANHTILISKEGTERPIDDSAAPIRNEQGEISGSVLVFRDISERKRNETALSERMRLLALNATVGEALVQSEALGPMLSRCAEALVTHLDGACARIWTLNAKDDVLELQASAGTYTHLDGPHGRVPVGKYKIGLIAQERKPHLTNSVVDDPRVSDQEWAHREGMVAFAGYPLVVDDRLVGVMAMFAHHTLNEATLVAMASVADEIAVGIERKTAQESLRQQQEWLRVTLSSIGDAVITTDTEGRVTFLNPIAEHLTGWRQDAAQGQPLATVFPIFNEQTEKPVDNPVDKVLREGVIVGLANHTVLKAKDGALRPIDDSAAPIRDGEGRLLGVVLIFRDVTDHRRAEQELRASEARKSAILDTALDCIITMDHDGNVVEFNPAAERTFGYRRQQVVGRQLADFIIPPALRERHRQGMAHYLATGEGPVLGKRLELSGLRADGTEFPVEVAITRIPTSGPPLFTAYLRDVSEHKRIEQHRNVRIAVTHVLSMAEGLQDGAASLLQAVCENLGWDVGFFWTVDNGTALRCVRSWHRSDVTVTEFESDSCNRSFKKGEGLPGSVWFTGKPRWLLDVTKTPQFPRAAAAAKYDLHSAFACPVSVDGRTLGVIEFFTQRIQEPDADLLEMMATVAGNFGQFLDRKTAEEQVRRSERELADFFENATVGLHWVGSDGIILRANRTELEMLGYSRDEYVGRPIAEFHADEPTISDILSRLQAGEELLEYPARLKCKDGSIRDVLIDSSVMFREDEFVHTRCFTRDVTESKRSEAALREAQRRFEVVFNQQFQFMAILAPDGSVLEVNETSFNATGVRRDQVLGRLFWETPWWNELPVVQQKWKTLISQAEQGSGPARGEVEFKTADGLIRHATAVVTGLRDDNGRLTSFVVEGHDDTERKQQEAALRESEEKLRLLADTIPQLAWMARPDGHIFWYNRRWYEYTGTTPEQMEGWGWRTVHDPKVLPDVLKRWNASIASGEPFDMVFPLKGVDNAFRPFLTRVNPLKDERGRVLYWFGTNTDVSELRAARTALIASEERLRLALEAGRMGVWEWNIRTGKITWSESLEVMHGLEPGTFGGTFDEFQQLIHPADRQKVIVAIQQSVEQRIGYDIEFRYVWPDGSVHWSAAQGQVVAGEYGEPERMIGICLDVTQRIRGEHAARFLADASATLAALIDFDDTLHKVAKLAVPYFADWATVDLLEDDGSLRRVAVAHIDPAKVALAQDVHRRFPPDPDSPQGVWSILRTGRSEIVPTITDELLSQSIKEEEFLRIMQELGLRSYIGVPLKVRGKTIGVLTFIAAESGHHYDADDLSTAQELADRAAIAIENARLYREVREADRRKDEFLATLAHELRNPLAPIRNSLQILKMPMVNSETSQQITEVMERQVHHLVRLVDDLLDMSRVMRGKIELRKEPVELASIVARAIETSQPLLEAKGHELTVSLPSHPLPLNADPIRLAQIIGNLLTNSAKYTEPNGRIWISAERSGAEVVVRVRDNGIGIAPDMLPHVFELFVQVDHAATRSQGGLGIGLTLVKNLVEMHQGRVEAHSDGLERGSEFVFRLPLLEAESQPPVTTDNRDQRRSAVLPGNRLLVVDDNRDAADTLAMMLRLQGHDVRVTHDGASALDLVEEYHPQMIFLDLGMPGMDGYEVARRIRQQPGLQNTVLAALTGWGQVEDRRRTQEAGFDHHLVKPVEPQVMEELLEQWNERRRQTPRRILVVEDNAGAAKVLSLLIGKLGSHQIETAHEGMTAVEKAAAFEPEIILLDIGLPDIDGYAVALRIRQSETGRSALLVALTGYERDNDRNESGEASFDEHLVKPVSLDMLRRLLCHPKLAFRPND